MWISIHNLLCCETTNSVGTPRSTKRILYPIIIIVKNRYLALCYYEAVSLVYHTAKLVVVVVNMKYNIQTSNNTYTV